MAALEATLAELAAQVAVAVAGTAVVKLAVQMETVAETLLAEMDRAFSLLDLPLSVTAAGAVVSQYLQLAVVVALTLAVAVETRQTTTVQETVETELALVAVAVALLALRVVLVQTAAQSLRVEYKNGKFCNTK
jgi:hypothetical protein